MLGRWVRVSWPPHLSLFHAPPGTQVGAPPSELKFLISDSKYLSHRPFFFFKGAVREYATPRPYCLRQFREEGLVPQGTHRAKYGDDNTSVLSL